MVSAVSDKQDGAWEILMQGRQDRQPRGARQSQAGERYTLLELFQQLLILRERANLI
jgi:hypothetical protein